MNLFCLFDDKPSQNDITKAQALMNQIPIEIGFSKPKYYFFFAVCFFLFIGSLISYVQMDKQNPEFATPMVPIMLLFACGLFIYILSPMGPKLTLTFDGFEAKNLKGTIKKSWDEIDNLRAMTIRGQKFISWKKARDPIVSKPEGFLEKLAGYSQTFNNTYAISNKELVVLMESLRARKYASYGASSQRYRPNNYSNSFGFGAPARGSFGLKT